MKTFQSLNPYTEEIFGNYPVMEEVALQNQLQEMLAAQKAWRQVSVRTRLAFLPKLAALLQANADNLALLASKEMGKLLSHAKAEVLKSATLCNYYFAEAETLLQDKNKVLENGTNIRLQYQPLGIVLGIFPWNFPFWQVLRSAIPTIVSGNAMLVKPAPNVPQSSLALQAILEQCGLPKYLFQTSFLNEAQIAQLIAEPSIAAVTLTGSEKAGATVASLAAAQTKPAVLELGGSDPLIVMPDADLEKHMEQMVFSRFQNNGQSCVAAKRFLVHASIYEKFCELLIQKVSALRLGNPLESAVDIGPQARKDLRDTLAAQVNETLAAGATILYQQKNIPATGYFYPPTILTNIPAGSRAFEEELFGPVVSLYTFESTQEAIDLANATKYGLGASIYTEDKAIANQVANALDSGMVYINQIVKSDVRIPFGGIKHSGFGRELGPEGLYAFCQVKAVWEG